MEGDTRGAGQDPRSPRAEIDAIEAEAKAASAPSESREAYAIDALVRVADASSDEGRSQVAIHLRVDHSAFERGHTEPGEICEIEGIGPVPVATACNLSTDALIYVLATKGTDITHYASYGRYVPDKLRLALEARDPVCRELGCDVREGLEIHHINPVDNNGETSMKNCCRLCKWRQALCTHHGWAVEVRNDGGRFELHPPETGRAPPDLRLATSPTRPRRRAVLTSGGIGAWRNLGRSNSPWTASCKGAADREPSARRGRLKDGSQLAGRPNRAAPLLPANATAVGALKPDDAVKADAVFGNPFQRDPARPSGVADGVEIEPPRTSAEVLDSLDDSLDRGNERELSTTWPNTDGDALTDNRLHDAGTI